MSKTDVQKDRLPFQFEGAATSFGGGAWARRPKPSYIPEHYFVLFWRNVWTRGRPVGLDKLSAAILCQWLSTHLKCKKSPKIVKSEFQKSVPRFLLRDAMQARLMMSSCGASVCLCVRLSRSYILSKRINILNFSPWGSHAILVFPYLTSWQYFDWNLANGGVECTWGRLKSRFSTNIWLCDW